MADTRFIYIFDLTDITWVDAFKKIIDAEYEIFRILDRIPNPLIQPSTHIYLRGNKKELPPETPSYIDSKIDLLSNNYYYNQILYYHQYYQLSFRISEESALFFSDVLNINLKFIYDEYREDFTPTKNQPSYDVTSKCFVVTDQTQMYYGNVWTFTRPNYPFIGMYGIKRSILDVIMNGQNHLFKGISLLLINKIIEYAKEHELTKIIVIEPLPPMIPILLKYGFTEHETYEATIEKKFIKPIHSTNSYFTYDITEY